MDKRLQEVIQELNKVKKRNDVCEVLIIVIAVLMFMVILLWSQNNKMVMISLGLGIFFVFVVAFLGSEFRKLYRSIYKSEFVIKILSEKLENVSYHWETGFDESDLYGFQVINYDLNAKGFYRSDDYLAASYGGVNFRQSDGLLTRAKSQRQVEVVFSGKVMELNNLTMKANGLWCYSKNFDKRIRCSSESIKPAVLEDGRFAEFFDVYTSNDTDVNCILTPQIKENLLLLVKKYIFVGIHFKGNKLIIAVNNFRDTFDVKMSWKKINYEDEIKRLQQDVDDIIEVIEILEGKYENGQ